MNLIICSLLTFPDTLQDTSDWTEWPSSPEQPHRESKRNLLQDLAHTGPVLAVSLHTLHISSWIYGLTVSQKKEFTVMTSICQTPGLAALMNTSLKIPLYDNNTLPISFMPINNCIVVLIKWYTRFRCGWLIQVMDGCLERKAVLECVMPANPSLTLMGGWVP